MLLQRIFFKGQEGLAENNIYTHFKIVLLEWIHQYVFFENRPDAILDKWNKLLFRLRYQLFWHIWNLYMILKSFFFQQNHLFPLKPTNYPPIGTINVWLAKNGIWFLFLTHKKNQFKIHLDDNKLYKCFNNYFWNERWLEKKSKISHVFT